LSQRRQQDQQREAGQEQQDGVARAGVAPGPAPAVPPEWHALATQHALRCGALEVIHQRRGGWIALLRIGLQRSICDGFERPGQLGRPRPQARRRLAQQPPLAIFAVAEGQRARRQPMQQRPDREDVRRGGERLAAYLLG
jgi:hypothetical protein